jgi:hypothetical protein
MKKPILIVIGILMIASMACTITVPWIPDVGNSDVVTTDLNVPWPDEEEPVELSISMGAGNLSISGGASALLEGTVRTNVSGWEPEVDSNNGRVEVRQEATDVNRVPLQNITNEWDLQLGNRQPIDLSISTGAYDGELDLSGIPLSDLAISDGASSADVVFDTLNPVVMDNLSYSTGASNVELTGLANANFRDMQFSGGAGTYRLDFSGELQQDAFVEISGGVSNTEIVIPSGMNAEIDFQGELSNISTRGEWDINDDVYSTVGRGPTLLINVDIGLGNVVLIHR